MFKIVWSDVYIKNNSYSDLIQKIENNSKFNDSLNFELDDLSKSWSPISLAVFSKLSIIFFHFFKNIYIVDNTLQEKTTYELNVDILKNESSDNKIKQTFNNIISIIMEDFQHKFDTNKDLYVSYLYIKYKDSKKIKLSFEYEIK